MAELPCPECGHPIPGSADRCPHCARPGLFPNVRAAAQQEETEALEARFRDAQQEAAARGADQVVQAFMTKLDESKAVIARALGEVQRLASSEKQGYATYYQLTEAEVRLPDGDGWDALRRVADEALFPGYKDKMRFAALALDAVGLCIAKLGRELGPGTTRDQFPGILLRQGATSDDDHFVEVHVWGSMTIRTFERVAVTGKSKRLPAKTILRALKGSLTRYDVDLEVRG